MTDEITITMKEYRGLKADQCLLDRLRLSGVDNWVGYEYAFDDHEDCEWCDDD